MKQYRVWIKGESPEIVTCAGVMFAHTHVIFHDEHQNTVIKAFLAEKVLEVELYDAR